MVRDGGGPRRPGLAEAAAGRSAGRTPGQIADHNLRVTLEALRRDGPLTRQELGSRSGLTTPGLTNILRRLDADGLVSARKRDQAGGGQASTEFVLRPDGAFSIGIRLHPHFGEALLVDLSGAIRDRTVFAPEADLRAAVMAAHRRLQHGAVAEARILGIGLAAEDAAAIDVAALRDSLPDLAICAERDCVAAVLAERSLGAGSAEGGLMFILLDERVRAGFLLQGATFRGVHGKAGNIGQMRTGPDHVPLDTVVGMARFRSRLDAGAERALAAGEPIAMTPALLAFLREAAGHLLDAIVAAAGFLAPGAILIGGDLPRPMLDALVGQIAVERGDTLVRPVATPWISSIRAASFPHAGIALGAALLPLYETLLPSPLSGG